LSCIVFTESLEEYNGTYRRQLGTGSERRQLLARTYSKQYL
jgi:hypothetical protein